MLQWYSYGIECSILFTVAPIEHTVFINPISYVSYISPHKYIYVYDQCGADTKYSLAKGGGYNTRKIVVMTQTLKSDYKNLSLVRPFA